MKRVGFIVNSRVPSLASLRKGMRPWSLVTGWDDAASPMSFMRFGWIAWALRTLGATITYELYRPWRRYDSVVFLKSMGAECLYLAERLRREGTAVIFEANVDYYTAFEGEGRFDAMVPTPTQRADAVAMTEFANAVIASSRHLGEVCRTYNPITAWVPDNVDLRLVPSDTQGLSHEEGRLKVWWSGMASKALEFLAAEEAWLALKDHIHLHLVTDSIERAAAEWPLEQKARLENLLKQIPHTIHRFQGIGELLKLYAQGGVVVSPRFLDSPYNLSHTEWKISLGMACALPAIASPIPSYRDFAVLSSEPVVSLCEDTEEWVSAFEELLARPDEITERGRAAARVVADHYATPVVALRHAEFVADTIGE